MSKDETEQTGKLPNEMCVNIDEPGFILPAFFAGLVYESQLKTCELCVENEMEMGCSAELNVISSFCIVRIFSIFTGVCVF
jgi:hypothetical protein